VLALKGRKENRVQKNTLAKATVKLETIVENDLEGYFWLQVVLSDDFIIVDGDTLHTSLTSLSISDCQSPGAASVTTGIGKSVVSPELLCVLSRARLKCACGILDPWVPRC
jgi:hypothetical protein